MSKDVAEFFDEQQKTKAYADLKALTREVDRGVADVVNVQITGRVLSIGGVWEFFEKGPRLSELTVLDLSEHMLKSYAPEGAKAVVGDLYTAGLPLGHFDTVVFALILHHVAQGDWRRCRSRVKEALSRAYGWLRPGGRLLVIEACPAPAWMPAQRVLLPLTKLFLSCMKQPLVVMHERTFYERVISETGFLDVSARPIVPPGADGWTWFPVFMAVPWLRLPLKVYPKTHIFAGVKPL